MSGRSDLSYYSSVHGGSFGGGFVLLVLAILVPLVYFTITSDPTKGLDYASGDAPTERIRQICFSDTGPCPPPGFEWHIPESGVVETRFDREDADERKDLKGLVRLESSMLVGDEVRDCPAVVDWSLLADGTTIAQGTVTANSRDIEVTGTAPDEARSILLTARRTDSLACRATFQWLNAGLD